MKTLVIVGSAPSRKKFDFSRQDCDIWAFNEAVSNGAIPRADAVFQLHIPTIWRNPANRNDPKHYEWLKRDDIPTVYMQEVYEDVPKSVRFPRDEIINKLTNAKANGEIIREVSCSPSWALAFAIYLGYERIEIYGVELASNTEYHYQQGNFKYWLGVAVGRGIEVNIYSSMFDNPQYGYEGEVFIPDSTFTERMDVLSPKLPELQGEYTAASMELGNAIDGFLDKDASEAIFPLVMKSIEAAHKLGEIDGALQENKRYQDKAELMKAQDGNFVFSRQEFEAGAAGFKQTIEKVSAELQALKGQLDIYHNSVKMAAKGSPKRKKLLESYRVMVQNLIKGNNVLGVYRGAQAENYNYMARLDAGIKAAGGVKSEEAILS